MRISDWSSDVCSSDLGRAVIVMLDHAADVKRQHLPFALPPTAAGHRVPAVALQLGPGAEQTGVVGHVEHGAIDRKSVVKGKSVSVRVDHGGRRTIKKKTARADV